MKLTEKEKERFWRKVNKRGPVHPDLGTRCWEWTSATASKGYGYITLRKKQHYTHRLIWEIKRGPIPDGMQICHHCDNPGCIRLDHLFMGTPADNVADMVNKGRHGLGNAKLTQEDADKIRELYLKSDKTILQIASDYEVTKHTISNVINLRTWTENLPRDQKQYRRLVKQKRKKARAGRKLTQENVTRIRSMYADGEHTMEELANIFSIDKSTVSRVINRGYWDHLPGMSPEELKKTRAKNLRALRKKRVENARDQREMDKITLLNIKAREVRQRYLNGEKRNDLASEFAVSPTAISKIVSLEMWSHVPPEDIESYKQDVKKRREGATRGEKAHNAKLTKQDVIEIRRLYASGKCTLQELANKYAIHKMHAANIVYRKRWKHV